MLKLVSDWIEDRNILVKIMFIDVHLITTRFVVFSKNFNNSSLYTPS